MGYLYFNSLQKYYCPICKKQYNIKERYPDIVFRCCNFSIYISYIRDKQDTDCDAFIHKDNDNYIDWEGDIIIDLKKVGNIFNYISENQETVMEEYINFGIKIFNNQIFL